MIVRRIVFNTLRAAGRGGCSLFSERPRAYAERLNYDNFFRWMQKSRRPIEAIELFEKYEKQVGESNKYMGITLRNLTRLLKKSESQDMLLVNRFVEGRLDKFKQIKLNELSIKELCDFLLFTVNFTSINCGLIAADLKTWIQSFLRSFIERFGQAGKEDKMHCLQIITSLIKSISDYFPTFAGQYMAAMLEMTWKYQVQLVTESPTFVSLLTAVNDLSPAYRDSISEFAEHLSEFTMRQVLVPTFSFNTLGNFLKMLYKVKLQAKDQKATNINVELLIEAIQSHFLSSISRLCGKDIEDCLPIFMENSPGSKFIETYTTIIAFSINSEGQACLDPVFIVQSLSYLTVEQMKLIKGLVPQWQQYFIRFLLRYFTPQNKFKRSIREWMDKIVLKQLISHESRKEMMRYCSAKYNDIKRQ